MADLGPGLFPEDGPGEECDIVCTFAEGETPNCQGDFFSEETGCSPYVRYAYTSEYQYNPGIIGMPLAGSTSGSPPAQTSIVVQIRRPVTHRVVAFDIIRLGDRPEVPSPTSPGVISGDEVLLSSSVGPVVPIIQDDGSSWMFRVQGVYVYLQLKPVVPGEDELRMGASTADTIPADGNLLPAADFIEGLQ